MSYANCFLMFHLPDLTSFPPPASLLSEQFRSTARYNARSVEFVNSRRPLSCDYHCAEDGLRRAQEGFEGGIASDNPHCRK